MRAHKRPKHGGVGSNQYQTRGHARPVGRDDESVVVSGPGLFGQVDLDDAESERVRCGSLWGTGCMVWVEPPSFSHGSHPRAVDKERLADNPATSRSVLVWLASDVSKNVRVDVAENPSTPPETLESLASDPCSWVHNSVATNRSTPPSALKLLAGDTDPWVRSGVAKHPTSPPQLLTRLSTDDEEMVRAAVAENPNSPPDILAKLGMDTRWDVSDRALKNPALPSHVRSLITAVRDPR